MGWTRRLRELLIAGDFHVLHVHSPSSAVGARLVVRTPTRRQRPLLVYTEHNHWDAYRVPSRWANKVTMWTDDCDIAVSSSVRESVAPARLRDRVEVLTHGIVLRDFEGSKDRQGVRREWNVGDKDFVFITVANFRVHKNYPMLLSAFSEARASNQYLRLVVVGQGPLEAAVRRDVERLGLADGVIVLGYRSDVPRLLSGADAFVLASHCEGFPIAAMEALTVGLPCIATAVGGLTDAVSEGRTAAWCPPETQKAWLRRCYASRKTGTSTCDSSPEPGGRGTDSTFATPRSGWNRSTAGRPRSHLSGITAGKRRQADSRWIRVRVDTLRPGGAKRVRPATDP